MPMLTEVKMSRPWSVNGCATAASSRSATACGVRGGAHAVEQDREFIAAQPRQRVFAVAARHRVGRTQRRLQPPRQADQQLVAGEMTQAVVDQLEAIDVEEEHREAGARRCARARPGVRGDP